MSDLAIRCENLSKQYRIGSPERYKTLREAISTTGSLLEVGTGFHPEL